MFNCRHLGHRFVTHTSRALQPFFSCRRCHCRWDALGRELLPSGYLSWAAFWQAWRQSARRRELIEIPSDYFSGYSLPEATLAQLLTRWLAQEKKLPKREIVALELIGRMHPAELIRQFQRDYL